MTTIGSRVRTAMRSAGMQQKQLAQRVGMTPDALSRALNDQRGFAAVELAEIAGVLGADIHLLITGEPDPHRLVIAARHTYDHGTRTRGVDGLADDLAVIEDVQLAYVQAGVVRPGVSLPADVDEVRTVLGTDFVRPFVDRLAEIGVDVVRLSDLSTAYSLIIESRQVIVLPESGNWFRENWSLAHELGHLALGHAGAIPGAGGSEASERAANAFAAELLLPETTLRQLDWPRLEPAQVADLVWTWGVSTDALRRRLDALSLRPSAAVAQALAGNTQKLLRGHLAGAAIGDPITGRMRAAGERRFPAWLEAAHLERIAEGAVGKGTLAWMLGVPAETLEVEEPERGRELSDDELDALLG